MRGCVVYMEHEGERVAGILRTREGAKPVVVSPGHRMDLDTALRWTLGLCAKYRLPEPIRLAKAVAKRAREGK